MFQLNRPNPRPRVKKSAAGAVRDLRQSRAHRKVDRPPRFRVQKLHLESTGVAGRSGNDWNSRLQRNAILLLEFHFIDDV